MNRIDKIINYLNLYMDIDERRDIRQLYLMHMYGVAQFVSMIALKRNLDSEIATMAGLLHDIHTLDTLDPLKHAKKGSVLARQILEDMGVTTEKETDIICDAISHHSSKMKVHGDYAEALKDADVLQHCLYNTIHMPAPKDAARFAKLLVEFDMSDPHKKI